MLKDQIFPIESEKVIEIIQSAKRSDLLTLFHLINYTNSASREMLIEFIRKFVPFIDEEVKFKLKNMDKTLYRELAQYIRIQLAE